VPNHGVVEPGGAGCATYGNAPGPNGMSSGGVWRFGVKTGEWAEISPVRPSKSDGFGYSGVSFDGKFGGTMVGQHEDRWARGDSVFRSADGGRPGVADGEMRVRTRHRSAHKPPSHTGPATSRSILLIRRT